MRLLITAHSYPPDVSGVAGVVHRIASGLVRRGHQVSVATSAGRDWPQRTTLDGVDVHRFAVRGNDMEGLQGDVEGYRTWVAAQDVNLVVSHCVQSWTTDALVLGPAATRPRVLVTHGLGLDDPRYDAYFERLAPLVRELGAWVAVSGATEEQRYAQRVGVQPVVIPNGVQLDEFERGHAAVSAVARDMVNVSNHNPLKGHDRLFEVAERLLPELPGLRVQQFGRSYPAARAGLGRVGVQGGCYYACRVRSLRSKAVRLRFSAARREVVSAVAAADLFLLTSTWEASPLVILEAMAAGTPWVALPAGDLAGRGGGVVVPDVATMVRTVRELAGDRQAREELAAAGRAEVAQLDWSAVVAQHEQLYEQLLARRAD